MRIIPEGKGEAFVNGTAMRAGQRSATEADEMTMKEAMRSLSFAYLAVAIEERFFCLRLSATWLFLKGFFQEDEGRRAKWSC